MKTDTVVDDECVYTNNSEIQYAKFNETTQICCPRSGVHDKCQKEQEVQCCGGKCKLKILFPYMYQS